MAAAIEPAMERSAPDYGGGLLNLPLGEFCFKLASSGVTTLVACATIGPFRLSPADGAPRTSTAATSCWKLCKSPAKVYVTQICSPRYVP